MNTTNRSSSISLDSSCDSGHPNLTIAAFGSFCITAAATARAANTTRNSNNRNDRKSKKHNKRHRQKERDQEYATAIFEGLELVVVTDAEPVREASQEPEVIVLAEVIRESHPSHSSSPQNRTRALYERWTQQQRYSKNRNRNVSTLLTSAHRNLNRIVMKAALLLISTFAIALYLDNTNGGHGLSWFPKILTEENRLHRSSSSSSSSNSSNSNSSTRREPTKQIYPTALKEHMFPDISGTQYRYHNIGSDCKQTFYHINSRANRNKSRLSLLADTQYKFVLGTSGDTPLDSYDGKFLLCHKPIISVIRISATGDNDDEIQELSSETRRRAKRKHTAAGTPIYSEDKDVRHTIREIAAKQRKKKAAHDSARKEALARGFTRNYDQEGYCISVTLEELRNEHQFQTHSGQFEYEKRTGSPYEQEVYYDLPSKPSKQIVSSNN